MPSDAIIEGARGAKNLIGVPWESTDDEDVVCVFEVKEIGRIAGVRVIGFCC